MPLVDAVSVYQRSMLVRLQLLMSLPLELRRQPGAWKPIVESNGQEPSFQPTLLFREGLRPIERFFSGFDFFQIQLKARHVFPPLVILRQIGMGRRTDANVRVPFPVHKIVLGSLCRSRKI